MAKTHPSTFMIPFRMYDDIIEGNDNDFDCDENHLDEHSMFFFLTKYHALLNSLEQSNAICKVQQPCKWSTIVVLSTHAIEKQRIWKPEFVSKNRDSESMKHLKGNEL